MMSKVTRRELRIAFTWLVVAVLAIGGLIQFFSAYEANGRKVEEGSILVVTILVTVGFFTVLFGVVFFLRGVKKAFALGKQIKYAQIEQWDLPREQWQRFVVWEARQQCCMALALFIKMLKRYGSIGLVLLSVLLVANNFDYSSIPPKLGGMALIMILLGPAQASWSCLKALYFLIEHYHSSGRVGVSDEFVTVDGEYYSLLKAMYVTIGYIEELDLSVLEIEYAHNHDPMENSSADNNFARIPIVRGQEQWLKAHLEQELDFKRA